MTKEEYQKYKGKYTERKDFGRVVGYTTGKNDILIVTYKNGWFDPMSDDVIDDLGFGRYWYINKSKVILK